MQKKICLITGANSGIGKEIALGLAKTGAHVILVCRNLERGQEALQEIKRLSGSESVDLLIADLSSQKEIRTLAKKVEANYPQLDVLINNAGLVLNRRTVSADNIEMTLATNHLAPFLLTQLLLNLMKKSPAARIVNVSSDIHKWASLDINDLQYERRKYRFMKAYAQSKLLLNITSFELARKLQDTTITVNCLHPGAVKTHLGSDSSHPIFLRLMDKVIKSFFITPKKAAMTALYLATSPEVSGITGKYFINAKPARTSRLCADKILAKKVWEISQGLVGIPDPATSAG